MIIDGQRRDLGGGLEVSRILPAPSKRMIGPFVFFDHMGPVDIPIGVDRNLDVRPHPHIGLSTVTYLFSGEITHRDSIGSNQIIRPQEINWMTAGSGITHSERFEGIRANGGRFHGIQAWIALPEEDEETAPSFQHHEGLDLPQWNDAGVQGQLIAGSAYGLTAATRTHSPLFYAHLTMESGSHAEIPTGYSERAVYVAKGEIDVGGCRCMDGQMIAVGKQGSRIDAIRHSTIMVFGGEPIGRRFVYWNFVSSSKERLAEATCEWKCGRMKLPDADDKEFIPIPDHLPGPANAEG